MKRAMLIVMLLLPLYSIAQDKNLQILQGAIDGRDPASITKLDLYGKGLTSLPPEIGQLKNLERLYLYNNNLKSLPPEIVQLQNLTGLDLSVNDLTSLPPEIGQLQNLTELDLSYNDLTSLPSEIVQLQNLTELRLYDNEIPEAEIKKIDSWFPNCEIIWEEPY